MKSTREDDKGEMSIEEAIDKTGFGLYSYMLVFMAGVSSISLMAITYGGAIIVPVSACELNTTTAQQGMLAAAPVIGSTSGLMIWGYLADTRGRRRMLLVALLGGATFNMVASVSVNWIMLLLLQFVASVLYEYFYQYYWCWKHTLVN